MTVVSSISNFHKRLQHSVWRKTVLYTYTALVITLVLINTYHLAKLGFVGKKTAEMNEERMRENRPLLHYRSPLVIEHKKTAMNVLKITLILVLVIEFGFLLQGRSDRDVFFYVHLGFAIFFLVGLVIIIKWYDGFHKYHGVVAYITIASFGIVAPTGIFLQLRRLPETTPLFQWLKNLL